MSNIDQTVFNGRERASSSDHNRLQKLMHRALAEGLSFLASGATKRSGCFGDSFIASPTPGTMKTAIGPGLALWADSSQVYPESTAVWVESREIREVTHDPGDPQARYDVIEMRPGTQISSTQPRDVFDPVTGTFTVANVTKEIASYPEFRIVKGTPGVTPAIPAGSSGWMPLAYVSVPAGAVTLSATDVVYCRPILAAQDPAGAWSDPTPTRYATRVKGGGVAAAGGSLIASVANAMSGRFPGYYADFRLDASAPLRVTTLTWDGGGLPAADGAVYFYAVPPPYPAGYDAHLAGREIWTPDIATIYSTNGGFYSATLQEGCIIVASSTAPSDLAHPSGHATGVGSFNHLFFSAAASSSDRTQWAYIGSGSFELAGSEIVAQRHTGQLTATDRKPGKSFFADLPIAAPIQYAMWTEAAGDPVVRWPVTATCVQLHVRADAAVNGWLAFDGFDSLADDTNYAGTISNVFSNISGGAKRVGTLTTATLDSLGRFSIKLASHSGCTTADLRAHTYRDQVLALR